MTDNDDIRRALHDAVDGIEPHHALSTIRERTSTESRRPWLWIAPVVAAAAVVIAVTVGLWAFSGNDPSALPAGPSPSVPTSPQPTEPTDPAPTPDLPSNAVTKTQAIYFASARTGGAVLFREFHQITAAEADQPTAAVQAAFQPALDPDYTFLPEVRIPEVTVASVYRDHDWIVIDLAGPVPAIPFVDDETPHIVLDAAMRTAQAAFQEGRLPVQFLVDGKHINELFGVPVSEPLANLPDLEVLAHVWTDTPREGDTVKSGATVSGLAAVFEAQLEWEIRPLDRVDVSLKGITMSQECCTMSPWSFKLPELQPGEYLLIVRETDPSDGEGGPIHEDTTLIRVQ